MMKRVFLTVLALALVLSAMAVAVPSASAADTVIGTGTVTASGGLNVRNGAGVSCTWVNRLPYGTRVEIYEKKTVGTSDWGRINTNQWVCLDYIKMDSTTSGGTQTGDTVIAKGTVSVTGGLNVRSGAGVNYTWLTRLANGTRVEIYEKKRVGTSDWGRIGAGRWVCLDYIKMDSTTPSGGTQTSNTAVATGTVSVTGGLNVRSGAGVSYTWLDRLANGTSVTIYEKKTVGTSDWGRIGTGRWVCLDYVKINATTNTNTNTQTTAKTGTVKVNDSLNVRTGAGTGYALAGSLKNGAKVTITETKTVNGVQWGKISSGWICMTYVVLDSTSVVENEPPKGEEKPKEEEKPAKPIENGWATEDGTKYYYKDSQKVTGWQTFDGKRYYFQSSGAMTVGYLDIDGKMYYFDGNGVCDEKMHFSSQAITILKQWEGFSATPYWDYAQYTVGYGTRCPDNKLEEYRANGISRDEAEVLLRNHLYSDEQAVTRFMESKGLKFTQGQFDAMVSLSYNCGSGWTTSTTGYLYNALINRTTGNDFLYAIGLWSTAGGDVLSILVNRRLAEANMYLNGQYNRTPPSNYRYVYLDANGGKITNRVHSFDANTTVSITEKPTYSGYTFTGWYTTASGGQKVETLSSGITSGTRLYAHWVDSNGNAPGTGTTTGSVIATGTVKASGGLNVRSGAGTGYSLISTLANGSRVEIYEKKTVGSSTWGKISSGWICLDYVTLDAATETGTTATAKTGTVKVTTTLTVRSGAGTGNSVVGSLTNGTRVTITEIKTVDGAQWGKISSGWICLTYVTLD